MTPCILIVIPAYNAARYLPDLIPQIKSSLPDHDLLVINDGSTDGTGPAAASLPCRLISFPQNRGKGAALREAFAIASREGYAAVITIDADFQHPPHHLPEFVALYHDADIIIGTRSFILSIMPVSRVVTNFLTSIIISIWSGCVIHDSQSGYRLIRLPLLSQLAMRSGRYDFESELLFRTGKLPLRVRDVAIETIYEGSASYINPLKDTLRFIRLIWQRLWY